MPQSLHSPLDIFTSSTLNSYHTEESAYSIGISCYNHEVSARQGNRILTGASFGELLCSSIWEAVCIGISFRFNSSGF